MRTYLFYKVIAAIRQWRKYIKSPAAPADRSARRSSSGPPCFTQMSMVSMINWWPRPWPWPVNHTDRSPKLTAPDVTRDDQPYHRYSWCTPKFKRFTWPNHAPFGDGLELAIFNLPTKYKVSISTRSVRRHEKRYKMSNGVVLGS